MTVDPAPTLVITTGGTIDAKAYQDRSEMVTPLEKSMVPDILHKLGKLRDTITLELDKKDSKEYSDAQLDELAHAIKQSGAKRVVVTHGTDRMPENASYMKKKLAAFEVNDVTVVFTGAMVPYSNQLAGYEDSDAEANVGFALKQVETLEPGVYIAFDSKVYDPEAINKDVGRGEFVLKEGFVERSAPGDGGGARQR